MIKIGCPFVFSELPLWDQPRRDVPQRTTTTTSMCIVPTDTSDCTHVMQRGASAAGNDGYAGIGPSRYPTRAPAAWTHIPAGKKRSSLTSIGTSNNATGGASGGRTPKPVTPAAYHSRRRKRSTAVKSVDPPATGNSRKKTRRSKPRKRSDAEEEEEEEENCHRVGRLLRIAVDESGEPLTAGHTETDLLWEAGIITHVILVNHRKLYFVHKGTFKCWFSANETLAENERDKIPNPHFPDFLDIIELEELGLVEYLDLETEPHPREKDAAAAAAAAEAAAAAAPEEPEPRRPVPPEINGLNALAAIAEASDRPERSDFIGGIVGSEGFIAVDTDTEEGPIAPRHTPRPERRHIRFVVDEGEDATAELLGSELGSMDEPDITETDITEPPSPMPAALPRTEPDAAWTQAMHIANEIRGGSVSMDTLKEDIVQRHQETSSPAPAPTQSTPIVSIYPIDESPNDDAGPRSVTPARLRQDTPSTILGGMGRLTGGHDLFGNLPGGEFPMDDDEDEEYGDGDALEHGGEGEAAAAGGTQREEEIPATGDEGPESDYEHVEPPRDDEANDDTGGEGDGDGDEEEDADEEPGEDDEGAVAVLAGVMTPEADDAAALLAKAVGALIAKIESNTATRTSLVVRAEEIDAQNEELGRTIEVMTATIDTLRGRN
jgi:hypothetical protein